MTDEVVTRLYRVLAGELRRRGHPADRPIKVADLYKTLVPYRAVRATLGVELNADYEHALLRLLSGERGLLRLEPESARDELRREVESPYPFEGLFRKFSDSDVWVDVPDEELPPMGAQTPAARPVSRPGPVEDDSLRPLPGSDGRPSGDPPSRIAADTGTVRLRSGGGPDPAPERPPVQLHSTDEAEEPERLAPTLTSCAFCGEDLPSGRRVRFCPGCGGDQRLRPCPRCEAVLERAWRYCIRCGHEINGT